MNIAEKGPCFVKKQGPFYKINIDRYRKKRYNLGVYQYIIGCLADIAVILCFLYFGNVVFETFFQMRDICSVTIM